MDPDPDRASHSAESRLPSQAAAKPDSESVNSSAASASPVASPVGKSCSEPYDNPRDYGYVFVLLGNLKEIVCDTWLGAAGASLDARHLRNFPSNAAEVTVHLNDGSPQRLKTSKNSEPASDGPGARLFTYEPWPLNRPKPYTVVLSKKHFGETGNYIAEIERYVRIAAHDCYSRWPAHKVRKNVCPLIATSLLGTGYGGNYRKTGDMVKRLLPLLYALADELKVDIAIVTIEEEVFALTNSVKKQFLDQQDPTSLLYKTINGLRYLNESALNKLRFLAAQAMRGELTLFVGAGASMGVGIPSWANLLNIVASKLGVAGEDFEEFSNLDYYTKAAVLESRLKRHNEANDAAASEVNQGPSTPALSTRRSKFGFGPYFDAVQEYASDRRDRAAGLNQESEPQPQPRTLGQYVAKETQSQYYSIVDAVLASLPCKEVSQF